MIPDHLREHLAEYLAGNMAAESRARFERLIESDPALAREAQELRAALQAIDDLAPIHVIGGTESEHQRGTAPARIGPALRLALAASIAFAIGFGLRGWTIPTPQPPSPGPGSVAITITSPRADAHVIEAFLTAPSDSDLARALVALARKQ